MALVLTTDSVAPRQRAAFWQEMVCQSFVKALCSSRVDESFCGTIATEDFGEVQISTIRARRNRVERRRSDIADCSRPRYYLCYQASGSPKYVDSRAENVVDAGEMIILNNCEPYSVEYDDNVVSIVLQIPQEMLRERFRSPDRCAGRKLGSASGINRITGEFLASCAAHSGGLTPVQRALTTQVSLSLLSDVLINETNLETGCGSQKAILVARMKQYVIAKASDPSLDLRSVAAAVGLSPRYVTKLFTMEGDSLGRFLLRTRIDRSKRELSDPTLRKIHVGEIGFRAGFNNVSHFSRVFRDATGRTPTEFRAQARELALWAPKTEK